MPDNDVVMMHANDELRHFLGRCDITPENGLPEFEPAIDQTLPEHQFAVLPESDRVRLVGHDAACVLHAVYTALEQMGVLFDITGPVLPERLDAGALKEERVSPAVTRRGIRQHINFTMDISSYDLEEAKEYIRNIARMRFNHITFHSYPGQWYECKLSDKEILAGGFFYDDVHEVPDHPVVASAVNNERFYCIPDIEPYFEDPRTKSRMAVEWLRAVISEAKRVGMKVTLSIEPRGESLDDCLAMCAAVVESYPEIDCLELMTQETGCDQSNPPSADGARELIEGVFGSEILDDPIVASSVRDGMAQFRGTVRELAVNIQVVEELRERWSEGVGPTLSLGIYATEHDTLRIVLPIMRRFVPPDVEICFMPAHGGRAAVDSIKAMSFTADDAERTTIYSWIEFDGLMYLQQNSVEGTRRMVDAFQELTPGRSAHRLAFNHWRTAENRTPARYASLACLYGGIDPKAFYVDYANRLGIGSPSLFAQAMAELDEIDNFARYNLFNIGFCVAGCWAQDDPKLGFLGNYKPEEIASAIGRLEEVGRVLGECRDVAFADAGRGYLQFMVNRIECTAVHLRAVLKMTELQPIVWGHEGDLPADARARVRDICDSASELVEEYMRLHARDLPDRGCEGTLISYYHTMPAIFSRLRRLYGEGEAITLREEPSGDAPPPPALRG